MSPLDLSDSPYSGLSIADLRIQLDVCSSAIGAIETAMDDISDIMDECEKADDETGAEFALKIFGCLVPIFEQTLADGAEIEKQIKTLRMLRSN